MSRTDSWKYLKFWFPVFLYSGIIFYISGLPNLQVPLSVSNSDKFIHFVEYGLLGFLVSAALLNTTSWPRLLIWVLTVFGCLMYGISDEFHQSFVPGRDCCLLDLGADTAGAFFGSFFQLVLNIKKLE